MLLMQILRMLADLSFYYAFASVVANAFSGNMSLVGVALLAISFGICAVNAYKGIVRIIGVLVPLVFFLLPGLAVIDVICYLPPIGYFFYLVFKKNFILSWYRTKDLFSLFLKLYVVFFVALLIYGKQWIFFGDSLPTACLMASSSVLLMRALRHEDPIYLQKSYQMRSLFTVGALWMAAWILSRKWVFHLLSKGILFFYETFLIPVLQVVMTVFTYVCYWILSGITTILPDSGFISSNAKNILGGMAQGDHFTEMGQIDDTRNNVWNIIFFILGILIIMSCVAFFFRFISSGRWRDKDNSTDKEQKVISLDSPNSSKVKRNVSSHYVQYVREQYKRYLKYYMKRVGEIHPYETSCEIAEKSEQVIPERECIWQVREIYLEARYNGRAEKKSLKKIKNYLRKLNKSN